MLLSTNLNYLKVLYNMYAFLLMDSMTGQFQHGNANHGACKVDHHPITVSPLILSAVGMLPEMLQLPANQTLHMLLLS